MLYPFDILEEIANFYETLHKYLDFKLQVLPSPAYFCNIPNLEIYTAPALDKYRERWVYFFEKKKKKKSHGSDEF